MKTFVIGDIHGAYKALLQCFERSGFDYHKDRLIVLGDVCDGYSEVKACIEELLKVKNLIYIIGNHDVWALEWFGFSKDYRSQGKPEDMWTRQGGDATLESYKNEMPIDHYKLLEEAKSYYIDEKNKLFVHGGIDPNKKAEQHNLDYLTWDRNLVESAWKKAHQNPEYKFSKYEEIFVGHTTTQWFARNKERGLLTSSESARLGTEPLFLCNVILLDTGAGFSGKLTIMDVGTHDYWQSDLTPTLYGIKGR